MKKMTTRDVHLQAVQAASAYEASLHVVQQLQSMSEQKRMRSLHSLHTLCQHIPHTTSFDRLVDLVVSCGGEDVKSFLERTGRNAVCTSHVANVEFIEALRTWVEDSLLKRLRQTSSSWLMSVQMFQL